MDYRIEKDTLGEVKVPADKLWGAQTERSRNNFKIGTPASMPLEIVYGFAYLKKSAAYSNCELGVLSSEKRDLTACYLKGGHSTSNQEICDVLVERDGAKRALKAPFQKIPQTHGTGCTLAAAFAVGLAEKRVIYEAAHQAQQFTQRAIRDSHSWKVPGTDEVIMHLDQVQG